MNMIINDLQIDQRSNDFIWTNEYIAKNMLAAHLDLSSDAASRNINTIKKTIKWIESKVPKNRKILDLGCGPGLYSASLSKKGYSVTGIDISQRSIAFAKKKASEENLQIDYFCKDYIEDDIGTGYDAVICIYCDFGALIPVEQKALLEKTYNSLADDGVLIFDVFGPSLCENKSEKRDWHYVEGEDFWCDGPHLLLEEVKHFSEQKVWGTRTIVIEEGEKPREYITWDHYYSEIEIEKLLNENKYEVISISNDLVAKNEFASDDVIFVEAKKRLL